MANKEIVTKTVVKKEKEKPVILITNDDDITSPGIKALIEAVKDFGRVVVVAPDKPQSGMGHAITIGSPLRMRKLDMFDGIESWDYKWYTGRLCKTCCR